MSVIRIVFLWHMHQPFYKDLVTGQYRLPWVRMHALKDYYGMVKLLDEFPDVHQTFNLVPSLIAQLQDYVSGNASDPFFDVAAKPAEQLSRADQRFALQYLFQANATHMIGRYPRYHELYRILVNNLMDVDKALKYFHEPEFTDLQVLSQLAWFDEFLLQDQEVRKLVAKGRGYSLDDQKFVISKQHEIMAAVIPAYAAAAQRGSIEISTSPYYHPILPLLCDTENGRVSSTGLPLPKQRFVHPEDARGQLQRGLAMHEQVFGVRPKGVWPSEGSVSDAVIGLAHELGVEWMATDEGVLGRSTDTYFGRSHEGVMHADSADRLYNIYRFEQNETRMNLLFRDHSLSDLIGFVYSGMAPEQAVQHFLGRIKASAQPVLDRGRDAVVPIILDGENAWEYFPESGRDFLRRLYGAIQDDSGLHARTVSEAIAEHPQDKFGRLNHLVPGSWIDSNFNVWIGAPEDNRAWDYLSAARDLYTEKSDRVTEEQRKLALEELYIAEGSDWNWWYGPEHHSANDADFDDLYRKHLSNVYQALGEPPPEYLAQPIATGMEKSQFAEQIAYIHPRIDGNAIGYFDWLGAAHYLSDRRSSAMHGKKFLFEAAYAGIDERNLYCRLDFTADAFTQRPGMRERVLAGDFEITLQIERVSSRDVEAAKFRINANVEEGKVVLCSFTATSGTAKTTKGTRKGQDNKLPDGVLVTLGKILEAQVPLALIKAQLGDTLRIRFGYWQNSLPMDALPQENFIELKVVTESDMAAKASEYWKV